MKQELMKISKNIDYADLLEMIQSDVSNKHTDEMTGLLDHKDAAERMKLIIRRCLINYGYISSSDDEDLFIVDRLYEDMSGNGYLSKYLENSGLEEININSWNSSIVNIEGNSTMVPESFLSPKDALDTVKRIASRSNVNINESNPIVRASLSNNTRMIALQYPVIDRDVGVVASIRHVDPGHISEKN